MQIFKFWGKHRCCKPLAWSRSRDQPVKNILNNFREPNADWRSDEDFKKLRFRNRIIRLWKWSCPFVLSKIQKTILLPGTGFQRSQRHLGKIFFRKCQLPDILIKKFMLVTLGLYFNFMLFQFLDNILFLHPVHTAQHSSSPRCILDLHLKLFSGMQIWIVADLLLWPKYYPECQL